MKRALKRLFWASVAGLIGGIAVILLWPCVVFAIARVHWQESGDA